MIDSVNHDLRISVAMCTYNGSAFLPEQLASIAAQTRLPDELVICDDGSTDSTRKIVADFARSVSFPIRWIRNAENLGSTKNFEQAIGLCTGDLIALSDQDDIWMPEKLARQSAMFERDPALGGVFSDAELVDAQSRPLNTRLWAGFDFPPREQKRFQQGEEVAVLLRRNVVTGATFMFRADLRAIFSPIPACWQHDGWIAWMAVVYSKLDLIQEPLIRYRIHASQQVGVEAIARPRGLTLRQRLAKGKRDEPAKHISAAREVKELAERLAAGNNPKGRAILPALRKKSEFLLDRGHPDAKRLSHARTILSHAGDYRRYESGMRPLLRDLVITFV